MSEFCPICEEVYKDCPHTIHQILKHFINPPPKKDDPESLSNQMKLLRLDFITHINNLEQDREIMKKDYKNILKIVKEIFRRVSL